MAEVHTFLDSDGVFFDFEAHFRDCTGRSVDDFPSHRADEMFTMIAGIANFWSNMPLMPGAMDLWQAVESFNPSFLSGCPRIGYDAAVAGKRKAIAAHFGPSVPIITCLSKEKVLHMIGPGDILIDDRSYILKKWRKAGGRGVLYQNAPQAIAEYQQVIASGRR